MLNNKNIIKGIYHADSSFHNSLFILLEKRTYARGGGNYEIYRALLGSEIVYLYNLKERFYPDVSYEKLESYGYTFLSSEML